MEVLVEQVQWIAYLERVVALAQNGLAFSKDPYDIERFRALQQETARVISAGAAAVPADVHCEVVAGALQERTQETTGARYWPVDKLPPLSRHRVLPEQIRQLAERVSGGEVEALFD